MKNKIMSIEPKTEFGQDAMQAFGVLQHGPVKNLLQALASSGQMRTAIQLQSKLGGLQSQIVNDLVWLEDWGLVARIQHESDSVVENFWAITDLGWIVLQGTSSLKETP